MPQCANFEKDILARKVGLLYSHFPGGAAVNLSVSLGIFLMFMPTMQGLKLYLWFAGSAALVFLRTADYLRYRQRGAEGISDARSWCLRFAAGSTAQGILWGVAGFFCFLLPI
jgi:hypothetical protein